MEAELTKLLLRRDLRKPESMNEIQKLVTDQRSFDELFQLIFHHERPLVVRAVKAVEKITLTHHEYLAPHKPQLLSLLKSADHKELKRRIAQLLPRINLNNRELDNTWHVLMYWALNRNESKIVRVNALQGLFELSRQDLHLQKDFKQVMSVVERDRATSIQDKVKKLKIMGV